MNTKRLEQIETERLIPYVNNARTHSPTQINKIRASLREFGFVNPVLIDTEFNIIAGHGRVEAAKAEGLPTVPCVFVENLTPAQKKAYILADNRLAELSGWDEELLKIELDALRGMDFDISLTGFDDFKFTAIEVPEDNFDVAAELEKPVIAQLGDVWTLGRHKIICGDSTKSETYERLLRGEKVQLVLTDPPYCVGASSNGIKSSFADFNLLRPFWEQCFSEWQRVLKDDGHIYCCTDWRSYPFLYPIVLKYFCMKNLIVWDYHWIKAGTHYRYTHELIMFITKKNPRKLISKSKEDVWRDIRPINFTRNDKRHQAEKPVELMAEMIKNSSAEGDTVLDCFMGSGTTGVACVNTGRKFIGFEPDEKYFEIAEKRIAEAVAKKEQSLF